MFELGLDLEGVGKGLKLCHDTVADLRRRTVFSSYNNSVVCYWLRDQPKTSMKSNRMSRNRSKNINRLSVQDAFEIYRMINY